VAVEYSNIDKKKFHIRMWNTDMLR